jgi:hypothetical protein
VPKLPQKFSAKNDGNVKLFRAPKAGTRVASGGMPHEDVLGGIHLRHEFFDMKVDMTIFVEESTATGKQLASTTPLLIFGQSGSAKSSISNATRCKVAGADLLDPFPVSDHGRGTSGIDFRSVQTDDWATSGCRETLVFFDTQGWELKDKKGGMKLMEMAIKKAIEQGIPEDVLRCRMICVLVIDCTKPRDVEQDEFLELVKSVCEGSKKLAEGCDVVLVPVFSKADALSPEKRLAFKGHAEGHLKKAIRHTVRVEEAIFVSLGRSEQDRDAAARGRKMTDGSLDGIDTLIAKLKSISREQLNSRGILDQVRKHVHTDCQTYLKKVAEAGLESEHALARRLVWADARALCLQVGNMYEALPLTCWKDSDHLFKKMQRLPTNTPTAPDDGWHVDPVRKYMRQWPRLCPHECPSDSHVSNVATETARQTPVQQLREDIPRNDIPRDDIPRDEEATMGAVRVASLASLHLVSDLGFLDVRTMSAVASLAEARKQSHASETIMDNQPRSATRSP